MGEDYQKIAKELKLFPEEPRTWHNGAIFTRHPVSQARVVLVDRRLGMQYLPISEVWQPHPERRIEHAGPGESCQERCMRSDGWGCDQRELLWLNDCDVLLAEFHCE